MVRAHVSVTGRVQGVGFRAFTQSQANLNQLTGWVRNLREGGVEAEVEGTRQAIENFVSTLKQGPPLSDVESVEVEWMDACASEVDFRIRY